MPLEVTIKLSVLFGLVSLVNGIPTVVDIFFFNAKAIPIEEQ